MPPIAPVAQRRIRRFTTSRSLSESCVDQQRIWPQQFGGSGLGLAEAAAILEEIHASGGNAGYAAFGKVIAGMDVVDAIAKVKTGNRGFHQDVPV